MDGRLPFMAGLYLRKLSENGNAILGAERRNREVGSKGRRLLCAQFFYRKRDGRGLRASARAYPSNRPFYRICRFGRVDLPVLFFLYEKSGVLIPAPALFVLRARFRRVFTNVYGSESGRNRGRLNGRRGRAERLYFGRLVATALQRNTATSQKKKEKRARTREQGLRRRKEIKERVCRKV